MKRFFKSLSAGLLAFTVAVYSTVAYAANVLPDEVAASALTENTDGGLFSLEAPETVEAAGDTARSLTAQISILKLIPVKNVKVNVTKRSYVGIGGDIFGIKLYTKGVIVVGVDRVTTKSGSVNPGLNAGIQKGDVITAVDAQTVNSSSELIAMLENSQGKPLELTVSRGEKTLTLSLEPELSSNGKYKAGLWVRDSSAGIGTVTFYNDEKGYFAGLGHGIYDVDTGGIMPLSSGEALKATVNGFYKSSAGNPGELCGVFSETVIGTLRANGNAGVVGNLENPSGAAKVPVALAAEVTEGPAKMIATIDETGPKAYDINIINICSPKDDPGRNLIIQITDEDLLQKTGGILQGMSGAPIIRNGMLVAAVTHVFVNDPTKGYAIFAENMLRAAQ